MVFFKPLGSFILVVRLFKLKCMFTKLFSVSQCLLSFFVNVCIEVVDSQALINIVPEAEATKALLHNLL